MNGDRQAGWCRSCHARVVVERHGVNNLLHLVLTIITAGIWLIIWLLASLIRSPWQCTRCGSHSVIVGEIKAMVEEAKHNPGYQGRR